MQEQEEIVDIAALHQPPKILIVDDRESERIILSKLLSTFNADIVTTSSGQEALSQLIRHDFVLVLLDMQMPMMDGLETAELMRSNKHTENIPIIFLTAYDKDEIRMLQGYKVGAIDYLFKPINREILLAKVQSFLRAYSFEKEKKYEQILTELEKKNKKLIRAQEKAVKMMNEANRSRKMAEASQKQIEEQATDLIRYTRELEQFAYVATHDFRAPMINLKGLLRIFKKRGYETSENKEVVQRINNSVERLSTTLNDLIEVVSTRKKNNQKSKELEFGSVVQQILNDLESQIKHHHVHIACDFKRRSLHYIPYQLRSILQNLIVNSIKYRHPGRKPHICISTKNDGDFVLLSVEDNGVGIEKNQEEKVFGLFQRLNTHTEGRGMGLYIVKSQVESMGGTISYTRNKTHGTTFHVRLKEPHSTSGE